MFSTFRKKVLVSRKTEEAFYSAVAQEMESGIKHDGLWLKALQIAEGNKEKQVAEYVKLRVQSLRDDIEIASVIDNEQLSVESKSNRKSLSSNSPRRKFDIEGCVSAIKDGEPVSLLSNFIAQGIEGGHETCINTVDACGDSLMHVAIKVGRLDVLEWLLENGANGSIQNQWGNTPLALAKSKRNQDAVDLIEKFS
jgi:ankyrin repeat protein